MKKSEFRKLIQEEIRKVLKEAISPKVYYFEYYAHQSGTITTELEITMEDVIQLDYFAENNMDTEGDEYIKDLEKTAEGSGNTGYDGRVYFLNEVFKYFTRPTNIAKKLQSNKSLRIKTEDGYATFSMISMQDAKDKFRKGFR